MAEFGSFWTITFVPRKGISARTSGVSDTTAGAIRTLLFTKNVLSGVMNRIGLGGDWDVIVAEGRYELRRLMH